MRLRRLGYALLVLLALVGVAAAAAKWYLASGRVTPRVAARLQEFFKQSVLVAAADVGLGVGSELHGVQVFESAEHGLEGPWLRVTDLDADVSALDLLTGSAEPSRLRLGGVEVHLRFDRDGRLLTALPRLAKSEGALPIIQLDGGTLTLAQDGRAPMVVHGIQGTLTPSDNGLSIAGTVADNFWGAWTVGGSVESAAGTVELLLDTPRADVTAAQLTALPFVSPDVWQEVVVEGATPVHLTLRLAPGVANSTRYRVEVQPTNAHVQVRAVDLDAREAGGTVVVEDKLVTLADVRGHTADGTISVSGTLDFRPSPTVLDLAVAVERVRLHALPRAWKLPDALDGRLTGSAKLKLTLTKPSLHTEGEGSGVVDQLTVLGFPAPGKAKLSLHAAPGGFRFREPPGRCGAAPIAAPALAVLVLLAMPPATDEAAAAAPTPSRTTGKALDLLMQGTTLFSRKLTDGAATVLRVLRRFNQPPPPGEAPTYLEANFALNDVDLAELVQRLKLTLPFTLTGRLSVRVQAAFPVDTASDVKTYRFQGEADLPRLNLAGFATTNVHSRLRYAEGVLVLEELRGETSGAGKPGSFAGTARYQVAPAGDLTATLKLDRVPLDAAFMQLPGANGAGTLSGNVRFRAPGDRLRDATAWEVAGVARSERLSAFGLTLTDASATLTVARGTASLKDLQGTIYRGTVAGSVALPLKAGAEGDVALRLADVDAAALARDVAVIPFRLEGRVSGSVNGKFIALAADKPRGITADVELTAPSLRLQGVPIERVRGSVAYRGGAGSYRLEGELAGGTFKVEGPLPPRPVAAPPPLNPPSPGRVDLRDVRLGRLLGSLFPGGDIGTLRGVLDASLSYRFESPNFWPVGVGRFTLSNVRWRDAPIAERIQGELRLGPDGIRLDDVSGPLGGGELRLRAGYRFGRGARSYAALELYHVEAARLLAPFGDMADLVEGPIDATLRLSGAGEWRGEGQVVLTRGHVLGVEVGEWRVPFELSVIPGVVGQLAVRDSSAQIAQGRALGRATLTWAASRRLEGTLRFFDAELRSVLGRDSAAGGYAAGRLTGRLDFAAEDLRSVEDLSATFDATLGQAQVLEMPVLRQVVPFVGLTGGAASTRFQGGEVRGRLARGVFRFQRFSLTSPLLQLILEGNVTLAGRLDLDVTTGTGNLGFSGPGLRLLGLRLPAIGPLPFTLLTEASAYLQHRLVHLRITGTVRNPIVQVEPKLLLTEEAVRFFLSRPGLSSPFAP